MWTSSNLCLSLERISKEYSKIFFSKTNDSELSNHLTSFDTFIEIWSSRLMNILSLKLEKGFMIPFKNLRKRFVNFDH